MTYEKEMMLAYLECALWASGEEFDEYAIHDIASIPMEKAMADCQQFLTDNPEAKDYAPDQVGHDLWLTRNHHGAGFWDRPEIYGRDKADAYTAYAHSMGERYPYVDDNGQVWIG